MDARTKSFRIFSFIVSGTFRSLLWSYELRVRVSAASARFCGKDEIAIGCEEDTTLIHERLDPEIDEGRGEVQGMVRCDAETIRFS